MEPARTAQLEVSVTGMAAGGDGVGRDADGRVVFVRGALPGERVVARLEEERTRFAKGVAAEVLDAAPERVAPPCPRVAAGCGGCGWQHIDLAAQRALKASIVTDALRRIGRLDPPPVDPGPVLPTTGHRTTARAAVDADGRAAFRVHHGHDLVTVGDGGCLVTHPLVDEVLRTGRFPDATEVTVRCAVATGERLAVVDPTFGETSVPDDVVLVGRDELAAGRRVWLHEDVAGRRWRVSADSFFQSGPDGAAALVSAVFGALGDAVTPGARLVDLYSGVGLFAGAVGERTGRSVVAVEANRSAVADAKVNLADLPGARVLPIDVRRWRASPADVVIADPSRHGLGTAVVDRIVATGAAALAVVSCDPAALGRDAGLLAGGGYVLGSVTLVDLFPHTPHVEVVTGWRRATATVPVP